jgi:hypothetical protein
MIWLKNVHLALNNHILTLTRLTGMNSTACFKSVYVNSIYMKMVYRQKSISLRLLCTTGVICTYILSKYDSVFQLFNGNRVYWGNIN